MELDNPYNKKKNESNKVISRILVNQSQNKMKTIYFWLDIRL